LCNELTGIASRIGWQYRILDERWDIPVSAVPTRNESTAEIRGHLGLKGIQLKPSGQSESLDFFFDSCSSLRSSMNTVLIRDGTLNPDEAWISVKTQYLSPETHVLIVGPLQYIKTNYISNLEVMDEGEYWNTGDYRILQEKMRLIQEKIEFVSSKLSSEHFGDIIRLSADDIADRIERIIHSNETRYRYIN
jgi:hypothetical protein